MPAVSFDSILKNSSMAVVDTETEFEIEHLSEFDVEDEIVIEHEIVELDLGLFFILSLILIFIAFKRFWFMTETSQFVHNCSSINVL